MDAIILISVSRIPVLLESNKNIHRMKIPEGNYEISFGDSIFLKNGFSCIEAWCYPQITWLVIATLSLFLNNYFICCR